MVVKPDQEQKFQILENAVLVARALGLSPVKIAVSAAINEVSEQVPHTVADTEKLIPRAREGLDDIRIEGPMSFDIATYRKPDTAVEGVAGDADIFLVDSIEECNIVSKSMIQFSQAVFSGVIVGAKVPVSLVSRTDSVMNKKSSLALACVLADYYSQNDIWKGEA